MAIGISTSCVRNVQPARLSPRNPRNLFLGRSQPGISQHGLPPRLRRELHATPVHRTFSASRNPREPPTKECFRSTQIRHPSVECAGARRSFSALGPQPFAVAIESGQEVAVESQTEHPSCVQSDEPKPKSLDMTTLESLFEEKHLVLLASSHEVVEEGVDAVSFRMEVALQDTGKKIEVEGVGSSTAEAKERTHWLVISELKKSGAWGRLRIADAKLQSILHDGNEAHFHHFHALWEKKYFTLNWVMTRTSGGERTFSILCNLLQNKQLVKAEIRVREERNMAIKACLLLISKLQEIGVWYKWLETFSPERELSNSLKIPLRVDSSDKSNLPFSRMQRGNFPGIPSGWIKALNQADLDGRCKLDISTTWSSIDGYTCTLTFVKASEQIHITTRSSKMKSAKSKAYFLLIHILQETRDWEGLVPHAQLAVDDDLLDAMDRTRNSLHRAGELLESVCIRHPKEGRPWQYPPEKPDEEADKKRSTELLQGLANINESQDPRALAFRSARAQMRVNEQKQEVLDLIDQNIYSIIVAETGSGKSSQIPQMILNDAIEKNEGTKCNVLCVQPRRLAAQMLAERVAEERLEPLGNTVGCIVRGHHGVSAQGGTITYCTTGIFLKMLERPHRLFEKYTHIILDEVHERDINIDFTMLVLKQHVDRLQKSSANEVNRKFLSLDGRSSDNKGDTIPKIIVASATVDVDLFSSYFVSKQPDGTFSPAPHIYISGRQYHVEKHFLDEILEGLMEFFPPDEVSAFLQEDESRRFLQEHYAQYDEIESNQAEVAEGLADKATETTSSDPTPLIESDADPLIPNGLLCAQIFHILMTTQTGSILVFLPGLRDLTTIETKLRHFAKMVNVDFKNKDRLRLLKLHSQLPDEVEKLSLEMPSGCRRIILSTDVAEASVTIPDLKYVVDAGRVNQSIFESSSMSLSIVPHWISVSSASQRAGRAGRVQEGEYFFIGTKRRFDTLRITKAPEILRGNLDVACLQAKEVAPQLSLSRFFGLAIEPPSEERVQASIISLQNIGALTTGDEKITRLGFMLIRLPMAPTFGKLIIMGVIFRCLEPMVILGLLGDTDIFFRSLNHQETDRIRAQRVGFSEDSNSDHIANVNAFKAIQAAVNEGGFRHAQEFALSHHLYFPIFRDVYNNAHQLIEMLKRLRILDSFTPTIDQDGQFGGAELNVNSKDNPLIKALLLRCLSPRIAAPIFASKLFTEPFVITQTETQARTGVRSINNNLGNSGNLAVYQGKLINHRGATLLPLSTVISPLAACLFGRDLDKDGERLLVDSWLSLGLDLENTTQTHDDATNSILALFDVLELSLGLAIDSLALSTIPTQWAPRQGQAQQLVETRKMFFHLLQTSVSEVLMRDTHRAKSRDVLPHQLPADLRDKPWKAIHA